MHTFQSFWFGDQLSPYHDLAMKSFVDHGHAYTLYAYKKFDVPRGVGLRDASDILPASRIFFYGDRTGIGRGSVSGFSNLFRYHLLHRMGGWWVDADVICLSDIVPTGDVFVGWEDENFAGSAILKFPAQHPVVKQLCDACDAVGTDITWGTTGPQLVTKMMRGCNLAHVIAPQPLAYPVRSVDALDVHIPSRRDDVAERVRGSPFLHIWNEVMRRAVIFPWMAPSPGSYMAELFDRHAIGFGHAPAYTADELQRLSDNYFGAETWLHDIAENAELTRLRLRLASMQAQAGALEAEVLQLRERIGMLLNSTIWRLTAPLRWLVNALRR